MIHKYIKKQAKKSLSTFNKKPWPIQSKFFFLHLFFTAALWELLMWPEVLHVKSRNTFCWSFFHAAKVP